MLQLQSSSLRVADDSDSCSLPAHDIDLRETFECFFEISNKWSVQTSIHIHTHMVNAVTLVWGSLRLGPINALQYSAGKHLHIRHTC